MHPVGVVGLVSPGVAPLAAPPAFAVVPSTRVVAMKGKELQHGLQAFVAPTATIIGDVSLGELSSVFYSASVRGA